MAARAFCSWPMGSTAAINNVTVKYTDSHDNLYAGLKRAQQ